MNCSEVIELMQRQLDHDLNESEQSLLTEHLNTCAACTVMFERLKMLNDGLEQLPKVMPKMSLVDSIMPQLDELDRLNAIQHQANAVGQTDDETPRANLIPLSVQEHKASQATQDSAPPLVHHRRWLNRFNWRTTSAVIAAGIVFGLFMVNYQPDVQESADFIELSANSEQMSDPANSMSTRMANEESVSTRSNEDAAALPQAADVTDTESASALEPPTAMDMGTTQTAESANANRQSSPAEPMNTGDEPGARMAEPDLSAEAEKSPIEDAPKTDPAESPLTVTPDNQTQEMTDSDFHAAISPEEEDIRNEQNGVSSTSMIAAPLPTISPDQQYEAVWEQGQLKVMKKDGENSSLLQSILWKTDPTELRWSADSKLLTVVAVNEDGQAVEVTYELSDKGLKQITVTKSESFSPPASTRSMESESSIMNPDVPTDTGNTDEGESSQP